MNRFLFVVVLVTLPSLASAQTQLERLEATSESMSNDMFALMVNEMAANGADPAQLLAVVPDMTWDEDMRAAGSCMLDEYVAILGNSGVDEMLTNLETFSGEVAEMAAAGAIASDMADASAMLPEGLSTDDSLRITQDCGMIDLQMERMSESGFTAAMMQAAQ